MYEARERIMEALALLGGSMGPVVWDVIGSETAGTCGETSWRETGHGTRGTWTADRGPRHLSTCMALIVYKHLITACRAKAMKSGFRTLCQPWDFYPS